MITRSKKEGSINPLHSLKHGKSQGQSFVELILVLFILLMIFAAVVEYGFMLNNYMHVLDGAREAARYSNNAIAFDPVTQAVVPEFYYITAEQAANTMAPIKLDPSLGDEILISVFGVAGTNIDRYPNATGWSLCANYDGLVNYFWGLDPNHPVDPLQSVPIGLADENWYTCPTTQSSHFTSDTIRGQLISGAPNAGILLVEIFYNYPQLLKLPFFSNNDFMGVKFSLVPDPIPTYVYTIMPISSAEPTLGP